MTRIAPAAAPVLFLLAALVAGCGPGAEKPETQPGQTTVKVQDSAQYHAELANECDKRRDWPCAHEHIDAAIQRAPKTDLYVYEKAVFFEHAGEFARCLETAKKAEAMRNEVGAARFQQAQCLLGLKRDAEAEAILRQLCDDPLFSWNTSSCVQLGQRRFEAGDYEGAKPLLARTIQLDLNHAHAQYLLGEIARSRKEWAEGARRCGVAFSLAQKAGMANDVLPKNGPGYAYCAADCELHLGNKARVEELCTEACGLAEASEGCQKCQRLVAGQN